MILTVIVWLALFPHSTFGAPEYSWTDTIKIYKDATTVHADIRTFTNNETSPIDVTVEIKRNPSIRILQYYKLSANETDFIIISEGKVTQAKNTYNGLKLGEKLCFTVEAKPKNTAVEGETATVEVRISYPLPSGDNPPTCSIVDPGDGQTLSGVYRVEVDATDDNQVSMVELSIDSGSWIDITANFDGTYYYYDWDTTTVSNGSHTLDARATDNAFQTTFASQVTVTVDNVPGGTMHVASIEMSTASKTAGPNTFVKAIATVTFVDADGVPVKGATVYGHWENATTDSDSGTTDASGQVSLESDSVKNPPPGTTFTFVVDDVVLSGWTYDPSANVETSDSTTV